jgi:hypothetical protein
MKKGVKILSNILNQYKSLRSDYTNVKLSKTISEDKVKYYDNVISKIQDLIDILNKE